MSSTYTLTASSALADDFIWTSDVLVDLTTSSPVGVFMANGEAQALFAREDGVLCQLAPAAGQSSAGWAVTTVGSTSGVTQAVAGTQNDGAIHGFYTDAANTYHMTLTGGAWSAPDTLPLCAGLNLTNNFITGELVAYGIDGNGHLLFIRQQTGAGWNAVSLAASVSLAGNKPVLLLTDADCAWVMALPGSAASGGYLDVYQGSPVTVGSGPDHITVPNPVQQVVLGYYMNNSAMFLFTDSSNNLYTNVGTTANVVQIPQTSAANATAVVDTSNNLHLYTVDPSGSISVLHQTGWNAATGPVWAPVIPLDKGFNLLFSSSNPMESAAFFAVDEESAIWSYVQDPNTQLWNSNKAQMPGGAQSYRVPQYRTEVTVVDQNGNPAPNLALSVTAASSSSILVQGLFYPLGPTQAATVTTGPSGKATVSTIATELNTPALTFSATGLTTPPPVNPAANVHSYLTGTGPLNPGTSNQLPQFSASTLQTATVDGAPLAPATQNPNNGTSLATAAFGGIQQLFQVQTPGNAAAGTGPAPKVTGFALDFSDRDNPSFQTFATEEEYQAHRRKTFLSGEPDASIDSWWQDVENFFEDVWQGIKNGVISVIKFGVHLADAAVDLVLQIGNEIHNLVGVVVSGIESVVSAVQGIFAFIGAEAEKLIDWLKMLFDWSHIMDTSNALQQALSKAFPYLQGVITNQAEPLVNGFFSKLEHTVRTSFDTVIAQFDSGQTLSSLSSASNSTAAQAVSSPQRRAALAQAGDAGGTVQTWQGNVQNNWLLEKIESFLGMSPALATVDGLTAPFETLKSSFDTVVSDFEHAFKDFGKFITTTVESPSQFATIGVADFLKGAKKVALAVLTFLDGIIEAFMQVISAALGAAGEIVTAPLDLPFFTALWNSIGAAFNVTMPTLSVSGVFCTAVAIPITVLYKLINGVNTEPFPGGVLPTGDSPSLAADSSPAQTGIQFTAAGIAALWALMDTALDTVPTVELMFFKILDVIAPTLLAVFTWPGGIPFTAVTLATSEDKASFANWIIGFAAIALDIALLVVGAIQWAEGSTIARYQDPVGKILITAIGAINLVAAIVASSLGASGAAIAANIIGPLPLVTQFLRLSSLEESSEGVTVAIKLVIDFFAGEGLAVAIAAS